jgi:hypothetical protein
VVASAAEAELGALFMNIKDGVILRLILTELGNTQPPTPVHCDNQTATGIANDTVKKQPSRSMEMRFFWIGDQVKRQFFKVYWHPGQENFAGYFTKHFDAKHHQAVRHRCHKAKSHRATFSTPDKSTSVSLSMVGFVDDSTGQVKNFDNPIQPTPKELYDAKLWNGLLWISGGLLELDKCSYHHIHFDFDVDGNASLRLGHLDPPITIPDNQSQAQIQIQSKSVLSPHKTLGHYRAPAGTGAAQLGILKKKSNTLGQQVSTGPSSKHDD